MSIGAHSRLANLRIPNDLAYYRLPLSKDVFTGNLDTTWTRKLPGKPMGRKVRAGDSKFLSRTARETVAVTLIWVDGIGVHSLQGKSISIACRNIISKILPGGKEVMTPRRAHERVPVKPGVL